MQYFLNKDFNVKAHKHLVQKRETSLTQEAWVVLKGKIKGKFFDLDDKLMLEFLHPNLKHPTL